MHSRKYTFRFCLVFVVLLFFLLISTGKLIFIQIFRSAYLANLAQRQHNSSIRLEPVRGTIFDRKMRPLAFNVTVSSLYVNPKIMSDKDERIALRELPHLLNIDSHIIRQRINKKKYFVWIARKLAPESAEKIKKLNIPGLGFVKESKRFYPNQSLAAHIIGFAGMDNDGLEGIELKYDKYLKGEPGWSQMLRDARQRELLIEKNYVAPRDGFNLVLTIDETIQYLAERALDKAFKQHNARGATIIIMNPKTGEILALANRPTYNLSDFRKSNLENRTNRAVSYVYEPGSVFKIVAATAALEGDVAKEKDKFFCENGSFRVGNHILHDHVPHGTLTLKEVFEQSSNIGVTKITQKIGPEKFYEYGRRFRFGINTGIDLAGEVPGTFKKPSEWSRTSIGAIPIGHEVTVTPLQLVCAVAAIANEGVYMQPFVVKYIKDNKDQIIDAFEPRALSQVMTPETAQRVKNILVGAVENGTGKKAQIKGVAVAGKTGTAQKIVSGAYSHGKFYASFIGFAPAENPLVAAVVVFDEPHPNHYGGTVAAPVFQEVIEDTLKYLNAAENP
ncbi:MAG: penicillin-binding transpeptidase domain-containing protein [Candidatus Omnitrophota bacterium]